MFNERNMEIYITQIKKNKPLSKSEEVKVAIGIKRGNKKDLERLVKANLGFVISVAKKYQGQGLGLEDLISAGNIGLITAAKKFDPNKNWKFISYAVWWIRQSIIITLTDQARIVRVPLRGVQYMQKIQKTTCDFIQKNNRTPTTEEVSKITGIKKHLILYAVMGNTAKVSFDATIGSSENMFYDLYYNENQEKTSCVAEQNDLAKKIDEILDEFTPRDKNIIQRYYGLNGYAPEIMDDIGEIHNITRERVRQILQRVLKSLRYRLVGIV